MLRHSALYILAYFKLNSRVPLLSFRFLICKLLLLFLRNIKRFWLFIIIVVTKENKIKYWKTHQLICFFNGFTLMCMRHTGRQREPQEPWKFSVKTLRPPLYALLNIKRKMWYLFSSLCQILYYNENAILILYCSQIKN